MKRARIFTLGLTMIALISFTSCQQEDGITSDVDALELEADAAVDETFDSVDEIVEGGIAAADNVRLDDGGLENCAVVTHDQENKTITIDFGDGCEGRRGNTRKGKILISYNDRKYVPGAYRIVTFEDFYFNDIKVEGTRTLTNTTSVEGELEFTVTLVGGKLIFSEDVFVSRDAEWVRTWFVGQGQVTLSGGAEGININGIDYSVTVDASTPILFDRACGQRLPVSGVKELVVGDRSATIDFGDGTCDRILTVTINGITETKTVRPRGAGNS